MHFSQCGEPIVHAETSTVTNQKVSIQACHLKKKNVKMNGPNTCTCVKQAFKIEMHMYHSFPDQADYYPSKSSVKLLCLTQELEKGWFVHFPTKVDG